MERISQEELEILTKLEIEDPITALNVLHEYEQRFSSDPNFESNCGGVYVDIGTLLLRRDLVVQGIRQIESLLQKSDYDDRPTLFYNVGNGYHTLQTLDQQQLGYRFDPDNTPLTKAKFWYRKALAKETELYPDLRCELWVNYGNCLSALGRTAEAITAYDRALQINPQHAMAIGNLGMELIHFADAAEHGSFLFDALDLLDQALATNNFEKYGGTAHAGDAFAEARRQAIAVIKERGWERPKPKTLIQPEITSQVEEYAQFSAERELFLNFCLRCRKCTGYARDRFSLSIITNIDDPGRVVRLSRVINEIRESHAFARFLFFQSQHPFVDTIAIDEMTPYIDNLDYAVYGTRVASLKSSFENAYGVLDKIAYFLSEYLELGVAPSKIAFTTNGQVWNKGNDDSLRESLRDLNNYYLFALYDIARDLFVNVESSEQDGYFGQLRRTRNRLAHEYIIPHIEDLHWEVDVDAADCHLSYQDLVTRTLTLLQLVKASVIYLISFIRQEEYKKHHAKSDRLFEREAEPYDATLFGGALDS
ncbi:hypothetical protein ANRL3_01085 [Anaerolineae bacterium]|nr:hypothetical protein ANRL3_01085 [Anaerolineae bacterium]